jgi:hypothetical protein
MMPSTPTLAGVQIKTIVRLIEGWIIGFSAAFASQIAIGGQPVDLSTSAGRTSAATGVLAAVLLALRRAAATP